jgi:hypothetical protein
MVLVSPYGVIYLVYYILQRISIYTLPCNILCMGKKGEGKILAQGPARTRFVSIPADVAGDSAFPFVDGERVTIPIEGEEMISRAAPDRGDPDA